MKYLRNIQHECDIAELNDGGKKLCKFTLWGEFNKVDDEKRMSWIQAGKCGKKKPLYCPYIWRQVA